MKRQILAMTILFGILASGAAWADNDCVAPADQWQPREALRQQVERLGWTVHRIKVDEGCYEVRGTDRLGNKIKAKYAPDSLRIRKLEIDFGQDGDASGYLDHGRNAK
ncbi:MAG: PepSY domain-containing protein [Dokdonella sp.]